MGSKSGGSQSTVQKVEPPDYLKPYLSDAAGAASAWYNSGGPIFAEPGYDYLRGASSIRNYHDTIGSKIAPGWQAARSLASGDYTKNNPLFTGALLRNNDTAQGRYLGQANPFLGGVVDAASRPVTEQFQNSIAPSLASQFSLAGRMGSGSHLQAFQNATSTLGRQLGDISSNIYGSAYENERTRMAQADEAERAAMRGAWADMPKVQALGAGLMPAMAGIESDAAKQLFTLGDLQRQMEQERIDAPMKRLLAYNNMLGSHPGGGTTTIQQNSSGGSRIMGGLGGGLMGAGLAGAMGVAAGPFAALGALGGLFG